MFYIINFFLLYIGVLKCHLNKNKINNMTILFISIILGFNCLQGSDRIVYEEFYEKKIELLDIEQGYIYLNKISNFLNLNFEFFIGILISCCVLVFILKIKEKSENIYFSLAIFFIGYLYINSSEPVIRQMIALAIVILGIKYIEKNNFLKYILMILIAMLFHRSAIIAILIYFLNKKELSLKKIIFLFSVLFLVKNYLSDFFHLLSNFGIISQNYLTYLSSETYGFINSRNLLRDILAIIRAVLYIFIVFFSYENSSKKKIYIKNAAIIYIMIEYLQGNFAILYRVNQYFILFFSISISDVKFLKIRKKRAGKFLTLGIISILYLMFVFQFLRVVSGTELNRYRYFNYKNYFVEKYFKENYFERKKEYRKKLDVLLEKELKREE